MTVLKLVFKYYNIIAMNKQSGFNAKQSFSFMFTIDVLKTTPAVNTQK